MSKTVLVIFGKGLPKKNNKWWRQFDKVIGFKTLEETIRRQGVFFIDIETLVNPGSVQEAYELNNKVSRLTFSDGSRVSKFINYQGYELWWTHYDKIYKDFCLPYTQYQNLLFYLKDFDKIYLYQPPYHFLFQYFLKAHHRQYIILGKFRLRNLLPFPLGVFIQLLLSFWFLLWLKVTKPKLLFRTSDKFDSPHDYDFRMKFIYEELRKRKIPFVEFIRSLEPWSVVLQHAWQRKRPVVYSAAIISFIYFLANLFGKEKRGEFIGLSSFLNPEQYFWLLVATHYLHNIKGTIWSIEAMKFISQWIGVRVAIIDGGSSRTFHELLGCKLANIRTIGIQHGAKTRYHSVCDFMPWFDGEKTLMMDQFGVWSNWWKEYYIRNSRVFKPEQFYVSGPMRPLTKREDVFVASEFKNGPSRVLFISEQLAVPKETLPYLLTILEAREVKLFLKFRPYQDGFEQWLKEERPKIYQEILKKAEILRGTMEEATALCDVVVGSHSTAILESLLLLKPFVFFQTNKWGDYFDIKSSDAQGHFFASNPEELIEKIRKSANVPREDLKQLQERFFGNPYQNGSKWVVEQAIEFLDEYKK